MAATATTQAFDPNEFAAKMWSEHAPEYEKLVNIGMSMEMIEMVLKTANDRKSFSSATAILDDGCGTGQIVSSLIDGYGSQLPANVKLLATDFSSGMIEGVERRRQRLQTTSPLWKNVETHVLDAAKLEKIPDGSLSHVVSNLCLFMVPQKEKALQEANRVLKNGGILVHSCIKTIPWVESLECIKRIRPETDLTLPLDPTWRTEEGLIQAAKVAGFTDVNVVEAPMPMDIPEDGVGFWQTFIRQSNPGTRAVFRGWTDEEKDKAAHLIDEALRQKNGDGPMRLMGTGYIVSASKA